MAFTLTVENLIHEAAANNSALYLTRGEVATLSDLLDNLTTDINNLREANRDWADEASAMRDDLREARQVRDFALGTCDLLLEQAKRRDHELGS